MKGYTSYKFGGRILYSQLTRVPTRLFPGGQANDTNLINVCSISKTNGDRLS
jgi:hypothetical protein